MGAGDKQDETDGAVDGVLGQTAKKINLVLTADHFGFRIDSLLAKLFSHPRSYFSNLLSDSFVSVNGCSVKKGYVAGSGDVVTVHIPEVAKRTPPRPLRVLSKTEDYVVINKPPDQTVHAGAGGGARGGTVVDSVIGSLDESGLRNFSREFNLLDGGAVGNGATANGATANGTDNITVTFPTETDLPRLLCTLAPSLNKTVDLRPGIVHRLDRVTSGCMIVALNNATLTYFKRLFKDRRVYKEYTAVVCGNVESCQVEGFISRHPTKRNLYRVTPELIVNSDNYDEEARGKHAETAVTNVHYDAKRDVSVCKVVIRTGRTHQIRVHLSSINHPVLGDEDYGCRRYNKGRIMLHSRRIGFREEGGEDKVVVCDVEGEMKEFIEKTGFDLGNL
jgi:23S rRNA-/tRNA-specific pseudouridylate synthase